MKKRPEARGVRADPIRVSSAANSGCRPAGDRGGLRTGAPVVRPASTLRVRLMFAPIIYMGASETPHMPLDPGARTIAGAAAAAAGAPIPLGLLFRRPREAVAARVVALVVRLHRRWRGLRASLMALLAVDPHVRRFHRAQRRRQLELLARLRARLGVRPRRPEEDAVLLFALERVCDAIAQGEVRDLGLARRVVEQTLRELVARAMA